MFNNFRSTLSKTVFNLNGNKLHNNNNKLFIVGTNPIRKLV